MTPTEKACSTARIFKMKYGCRWIRVYDPDSPTTLIGEKPENCGGGRFEIRPHDVVVYKPGEYMFATGKRNVEAYWEPAVS